MITWSAFAHSDVWNPQIKNHTVVFLDGHRVLLFGGYSVGSTNCNKVYVLDINTQIWTEIQTTGTSPSRRNGHSAVIIGNKMVVIGGWDSSTTVASADIFQLGFDTWTWSKWSVELSSNMCTAAYTQGLIYIFRGGDGQNYYNDMYTIHPTTFELKTVETQGTSPSVRANYASVILNDCMYIVGGWDGTKRFDDMYRFHIPSCTWELMAPIADQLVGATLTHYRLANMCDYLVLCGGVPRISLYNVSRNEWHTYTPQPASSTELTYLGRSGHCAISMLPDQPQIIIIGGTINGEYPSSTLLFDLSQIEPDVRVECNITSEFASFFDNEKFSDFRLHFIRENAINRIEGENAIIHAHRIVLASRNDRFKTMLSERWGDIKISNFVQDLEVKVSNVSFNTFYEMIRFIYTGKIEEVHDPIGLLKLSDSYMIPGLKQCCEGYLKKGSHRRDRFKYPRICSALQCGTTCYILYILSII